MKKNKNNTAVKTDPFETLKLDLTQVDVTIKKDDKNPYALTGTAAASLRPAVEEGVLTLAIPAGKGQPLTISVPADKELSLISLTLNGGSAALKGVKTAQLDAESTKGDLKIRRSSIKAGTVKLTGAALDVDGSTVEQLSLAAAEIKKDKTKKAKKVKKAKNAPKQA